ATRATTARSTATIRARTARRVRVTLRVSQWTSPRDSAKIDFLSRSYKRRAQLRHCLRITALLFLVGLALLAAGCGGSTNTAGTTSGAGGANGGNGNTNATGSFASTKNCLAFANLVGLIATEITPSGDLSPVEGPT